MLLFGYPHLYWQFTCLLKRMSVWLTTSSDVVYVGGNETWSGWRIGTVHGSVEYDQLFRDTLHCELHDKN